MGALCGLFGASKQAYYQRVDDNIKSLALCRFIIEFAQDIRGKAAAIGGEKLWVMYNQYFGKDYSIGRDAFLKVLKQHNLMLKAPRRSCRTTDSTHGLLTYPNIINDILIHHSDRGVQYANFGYINELRQKGIRISMTQNGDPKENAIAERVNGILKKEFLNQYSFQTIEQVRQAVQEAVTFYNTKRPHRSLDMLTPEQAYGKTGVIKKRWRSYKDKYRDPCPQ